MSQVQCPSCGAAVEVPGTKKGTKVAIGCLIAAGLALAAIAIPSFVKARETAQTNACINNMRMIDSAKEKAAIMNNHADGAAVPSDQLSKFLMTPVEQMSCVAGGAYTVNPLGTDPSCSIHGHMSGAQSPPSHHQQR